MAAGPYNDPTLGIGVGSPGGMNVGGTGKFYAVVLEHVSGSEGASGSGSTPGPGGS